MSFPERKRIMERAFLVLQALQRQQGITVLELSSILVTNKFNAWKYLQEASRLFPVYESGKRRTRTKSATVYKMLEKGGKING